MTVSSHPQDSRYELRGYRNTGETSHTFQPDENLDVGTSPDRAQATTWGRIPKTYVRLAADASLPLAVQDRMIREADALTPDNPFDVRTLEGSHLHWLVHPKPAAELLANLAAR